MTIGTVETPPGSDGKVDRQAILRIVARHGDAPGAVMAVLADIQADCGYLPEEALRAVAESIDVSLVDVYGAATFYRSFSRQPRGRHVACVCLGTACHVRGAPEVLEACERQLGIRAGETTPDREFTLETVNCLGACALGPIVAADGRYYPNVTTAGCKRILKDLRAGHARVEEPVAATPGGRLLKPVMQRLDSIEHFRAFQRRILGQRDPNRPTVVIPAGTCGRAGGALQLVQAAKDALVSNSGSPTVGLRVTGCHGFCQLEPSVLVEPGRIFYPKVDPKDTARIVDAAARGEAIEDLLFEDPRTGERIRRQDDLPFYRRQVRTVLSRIEKVDPTRIETYIEIGGYSAIAKVLERGDPTWVLSEVKASGLRGRGGAGFPTGVKWELLAQQPNGRGKFIVCNADEGDPGAYMDRSVLEGNPQGIIEGMLIGAYGTGATAGIVYVRNEYPLAIEHLTVALNQARELGLLGRNVLGTGFSFDISMVRGAGAFVCGEETALIRSIEGRMGEPRQRPPFPIQKGIGGKPTAINNVETWANIPVIIERGARTFARLGTKDSSGTKIFSLVGKIRNTGLVEVPMGVTIEEIVRDIGGGPADGSPIKAVQTGGPSGGCIPAAGFDRPIDYDSLAQAGSIMGSGGMIVMDETTCMVDVAKYFMGFLKDESCGKCFICRKGTQRMHEILDDVSAGRGTAAQLDLLEELALTVKDTTMCGLGNTAANPVLATLRYFRDEYMEHIERQRCPAGVCRALLSYSIGENCTGCRNCVKACPAGAVSGQKKQRHAIDPAKCIRCGACRSACRFDAVVVA